MKKISPMKSKKVVIYVKKNINTDKNDKNAFKLYHKIRDHCHYTGKYRGAAHNICNLRYKPPREIPVVFPNDSTYNYHFIINELATEFEGKFECLGGNTEKYITFSVPIKKELDNGKIITYKLEIIDMQMSLSKRINNLSEIYSKECKRCRGRNKIVSVCDFIGFKNNILH